MLTAVLAASALAAGCGPGTPTPDGVPPPPTCSLSNLAVCWNVVVHATVAHFAELALAAAVSLVLSAFAVTRKRIMDDYTAGPRAAPWRRRRSTVLFIGLGRSGKSE